MLGTGAVVHGRYRIQKVLAQGATSTVYVATDSVRGWYVALKRMTAHSDDPASYQRAVDHFMGSARLFTTLSHPGLARVFDAFLEEGVPHMVMELVAGHRLDVWLRQAVAPVSLRTMVDVADQLADVLQYLHHQQPPIVVRDLHPGHLLVDDNGRLHMVGLDTAMAPLPGQVPATLLKGTGAPGYTPVEQLGPGRSVDPRTDVYALGALLYLLLSGTAPPSVPDRLGRSEPLTPPSQYHAEVTGPLDAVVLTMLALQKEDRYQTMDAARHALRVACPETLSDPSQPGRAVLHRVWRPDRRGRLFPMCSAAGSGARPGGPVPAERWTPGTVLRDRYVIDKVLSRQDGGAVYQGHLASLQSKGVAIKVVWDPEDAGLAHFQQEATLMALADHPNLVSVNDFFVQDGAGCLVMDYLDGATLEQILTRFDTFLPLSMARRIIEQLCDALEYLHRREPPVLFRDLCPANVMVMAEGKVRLINFGVARTLDVSRTSTFLLGQGTHGFAPVEQYVPDGHTDQTSDLYALGAVMYAVLTRLSPPPALDMLSGQASLVAPESLRPELSPALGLLIRKLMSTRKTERCQTAAEVRTYFRAAFEAPEPPVATVAPPTNKVPLVGKKRPAAPAQAPAVVPRVQLSPAFDRLLRAVAEGPEALPDHLRCTPPRLQAVVHVQPGMLDFLKGTPPRQGEYEPVTVVNVTSDSMTFRSMRPYRTPCTLAVRLAIPLLAAGSSLIADVQLALTSSTQVERQFFEFQGQFHDLPPKVRSLLDHALQQERRQVRRFKQSFQVMSKALAEYRAVAVDVSPLGVGLYTPRPHPVGQEFELFLDLGDRSAAASERDEPASARVSVVHSVPSIDGRHRLGLAFQNMPGPSVASLLSFFKELS